MASAAGIPKVEKDSVRKTHLMRTVRVVNVVVTLAGQQLT